MRNYFEIKFNSQHRRTSFSSKQFRVYFLIFHVSSFPSYADRPLFDAKTRSRWNLGRNKLKNIKGPRLKRPRKWLQNCHKMLITFRLLLRFTKDILVRLIYMRNVYALQKRAKYLLKMLYRLSQSSCMCWKQCIYVCDSR